MFDSLHEQHSGAGRIPREITGERESAENYVDRGMVGGDEFVWSDGGERGDDILRGAEVGGLL